MSKKRIFTIYLAAFLLIGIIPSTLAQNNSEKRKPDELLISNKKKRKLRPAYINIGMGVNSSYFRDFATSPLFYNGNVLQVSFSKLRKDYYRETEFGFSYDFGNYQTTFNDNITISQVKKVELFYSRLYNLKKLSSNSFNTKIGFQVNSNGNLRVNEELQNNALGIEIFNNLLGSIKVTKDISRKQTKEKKIWFIKYKLNEKKRELAFRLNMGIINSALRNGYIYGNQSGVLNSPKIFDRYEYKLFSGVRMGSRLDYTRFLKNKNAIQFSYIWDAYKTGGELDVFEMAHHTFRFTFLFNTNNQ
jgi:hypothetical protein